MNKITDHILLADFGMDQDSAHRYMAKGSSPYFLNCLKGEDGSYGELTNLKGNRSITYELGDSEVYFVAWSCYDYLTRNVYYYIFSLPYDTTGSGDYEFDNRFIRFNEDSEEITTLFYDNKNYFGVDPVIRVKDVKVLGDWLFYNPQTSEPKVIDLTMIYNYTTYDAYDATAVYTYGQKVTYFGGLFLADVPIAVGENPVSDSDKWTRIGNSYQDETDIEFDSEFRYAFNLIKHIPVYRPICNYASDPDKNANNVRGKLFRFSHRYKFFDNSYSRYSAFSDVTLPQYDELYNGEVTGDLDEFNCIDIKIPLHSASLIKEIDIIFQETGGDWKRAKIINRQDIELLNTIHYTHRFYNTDSAYDLIDDTLLSQAYDAVPRVANSQEIINKNMLTFGGCTEGFDNIDKNLIDVTLSPEIEAITVADDQNVLRRNLVTDDITQDYEGDEWVTTIDMSWCPNPPPPSVQISDVLAVRVNGQEYEYEIQAADVVSFNALMGAIETFLIASYPTMGWVWIGNTFTASGYASVTDFSFWGTGATRVELTKKRGFKTGAWHPFCIFYYDEAMRRWDAQTSKDHPDGTVAWSADGTTVYIPMLGEYSPVTADTAYKWNINWEINHLPPTNAKWWRWGYAGNALASEFVQYIIEDIDDVGATSTTEPINTTWIDISPLQTITNSDENDWNKFPNSIISPWSYTKGDRVRFITKASAANDMGAVIEGVYDYEILAENIDDNKIYIQVIDHATLGIGEDTLIEIYRPKKTDTAILFHEFGNIMPIIEDAEGIPVHGVGATGTQNQDTVADDPALGVFTAGDVYHILRTPSKPINGIEGWFHESQWYSDFYASDDWDKGRIGVETQFGERFLNIVRHSNQYLQNTLINGLSSFNGGDYKELNDIFGDILRIIEIGDTLKVYQRKKPSSILVGRTEYVDAAGKSNIVEVSDRVFGSIRYSTTDYGTEFPESISRNNRYVYGFDIYNGVMWRDAANGIFPVSGRYESTDGGGDYKMETYFKAKAKALLVSGIEGVDVETCWDERHKNLYVVFKDVVTETNNEALMFHEPSNKWICFTDLDRTYEDGWNQMVELQWAVLQGFDGGLGYVFDEDTRFATFNVVTTRNEASFPVKQDLAMELFTPTVIVDCTVTPGKIDLSLSNPYVTPFIPYVAASVPALAGWTASQYGISSRQNVTITSNPNTYIIHGIPSWLWVDYETVLGSHLSVGNIVSSGVVLAVYPKEANVGGAHAESLVFVNNYGNSVSVSVAQDAPLADPSVRVLALGGDDNAANALENVMTVAGTCAVGSSTVNIQFTCDHKDIIDTTDFWVFATVEIKDSQYGTTMSTTGSGSVYMNITETGVIAITNLSISVLSGYWVYVYLSSPRVSAPVVNTTATPSLNSLTIDLSAPTVIITLVSPTTVAESWLATESGVADAVTFQIDTGDAVQTRLSSYPSWISVVDSGGNDLKGGHYIVSGENCKMYPTNDNLSGSNLTGTLVFLNEYGDTNSITVQHDAAIGPEPIALWISDNDTTDLDFMTGIGRTATLNDGTSQIDLVATFDSPTYSTGNFYYVYWYATKNGIFAGRGNFPNWDELENTQTIFLDANASIADTIVIYFSGNQIYT